MVEHRVIRVGQSSKAIVVFDKLAEIYDIDLKDNIHIDWNKCIQLGLITFERKGIRS